MYPRHDCRYGRGASAVSAQTAHALLDTQRTLETPEGVELTLRIAGPVVRALAWSIDFSLRVVIYSLLVIFGSMTDQMGEGLFLLSFFLLEWFYPVYFEIYRGGVTPGKARMGIKVLYDNGTPIGWTGSMLRNLLRAVDSLPFFYGVALISMLLTRDFQRLGDLAAGTLVVYSEPSMKKKIQIVDATPLALPILLNDNEQQAIINFAERASILPPARVTELADLARNLTAQSGETAEQTLYRIANGLYR